MSKSMGLRNSGKLDFKGKGAEYGFAAVIAIVIILALVFVVRQVSCSESDIPVTPDEFRVKCIECEEEWMMPREEMMHETEQDSRRNIGMDCPKCDAEESVFKMIKCPKCGTYYLSKRDTEPDEASRRKARSVCPECGTDLLEWNRKRFNR